MSVKAKHVLGFTQINVILVVVRVTCPKYKRKLSLFYLLCSCKGKGKGNGKGKANPSQAWAGPEVSSRLSPRFQDNRHMKLVRLLALRTGRLYPPGNIPGTHFC